jgi:D,D-heptose 1,7-bisphosphate phosphatase
MLRLPWRIPLYIPFRAVGWPRLLPLNVTVSVTDRCNSRCRTCNIWKKEIGQELTADELDRVFRSLGRAPYWITFSGGEPFLRRDLEDLCHSAYTHCHPAILNIPTNGLLHRQIPARVAEIARRCPDSQLIVNLSLDGVGARHDEIRNVPGNFERAMDTYRGLKEVAASGGAPNLTVGLHTVISAFNLAEFDEVYALAQELEPDSYVTEIAEERVELGTVGSGITPSADDYARVIDHLSERLRVRHGAWRFGGISRVTQALRLVYYDLVKRIMRERRQVIPCYAGWLSGHILPDGEVWECSVMGTSMGNLRDVNYDMRKLWFGDRAKSGARAKPGACANQVRRAVKTRGCYCPVANISYTNMMCDPQSVVRVALNVVRGSVNPRPRGRQTSADRKSADHRSDVKRHLPTEPATRNAQHGTRNPELDTSSPRPAAFFDRDGTINREVEYLARPEQLELLPGTAEGMRRLQQAGYRLVIVTNQAGVARGYYGEEDVEAVHERLREMLRERGVEVDAIYYCPHHPEGQGEYRQACPCRKPGPGMYQQAARELNLDLARSVAIGDKVTDLLPGIELGCRTVLVRTGYGQSLLDAGALVGVPVDHVADSLIDAAEWMLTNA